MSHPRNVVGLRENARKRHEETVARAEIALTQLAQTDTPLTFAQVAQAADVSLSWLYKQPRLRARIQAIREQQPRAPATTPHPVTVRGSSPADQAAAIAALKEQVRLLRAENHELRQQLEVVYGQLRR